MRTKTYQSYFEEDLLEASPVKLVQLLYRGALDSIASARRHLRLGDIRPRSEAVTKAMAIVTELARSLNAEQGGELTQNLDRLYGYIERLLIQANFEQRDQPLQEAERLLSTLADAWASFPAGQSTAGDPPLRTTDYEPVSCAY